ncbi:hypothetical protein HK097_008121 [Rhizophlyctis rosea]|uniref:Chromo domain-containing protein n=1 Tax=Rhizophlyctis rosea TaxID=64517 RepID=A0AAD5X447_9FUNG|nr:hypothetical protein HK097_008121 [Rhizophlyctis rosea]
MQSDLKEGDFVRRRNKYTYTGIVKGTKVGFWSQELYKIERVVPNRKWAHMASSYKIRNIDDDVVVEGLVPRGKLQHVPDPENMDRIPERVVRPGAVNEETNEYKVEAILDKKVGKRTRGRSGIFYKILWKGWVKPEWVAKEDMNAPDLIREYERNHG